MRSVALLLALIATPAFAATFETQIALEREPFEYAATEEGTLTLEDPVDDLIVFDRDNRGTLPPVLADLTRMSVEPRDDGWIVTFELANPLPEDPGLAVNFDVFIDRDGDESNDATTGVFRAHSDTIFMLLHGTRTKWHSKWWTYDSATGRWNEQPNDPEYTLGDSTFTLKIPYAVIPREAGVPMRGFSLTSTGGITAIDIVPGTDFPPVLAVQPQPPQPTPTPPPTPTEVRAPSTGGLLSPTVVYSVIAFLLGVSLTMWWVRRKGRVIRY